VHLNSFTVGIAAALLASILFNVGVALQALEARELPRRLNLRLSLLGVLFRRPLWVLGLALGGIGIAPQVLAFGDAPFVVIQPALASGLLLLLLIGSRVLSERVGLLAVLGVIAIIAGVALVAWGAPAHTETHRGPVAVVGVVLGLSAIALAPFPLRGTRFDSALLTVLASGAGFAATNVATKLLSDDVNANHYVNAITWGATGLPLGVAATVTNMTAFQRRPATMVVPVTTAVQTFLPIVLEPLFLREPWGSAPFDGLPIIVGLTVALLGTILVSRTHAVSELTASTQRRGVSRGRRRRRRRRSAPLR
jgi:drug/metabolite transporter (DMT)-like permease